MRNRENRLLAGMGPLGYSSQVKEYTPDSPRGVIKSGDSQAWPWGLKAHCWSRPTTRLKLCPALHSQVRGGRDFLFAPEYDCGHVPISPVISLSFGGTSVGAEGSDFRISPHWPRTVFRSRLIARRSRRHCARSRPDGIRVRGILRALL